MREGGQTVWWRKTGQLAAATLAVLVAVSLVPLLFGGFLAGRTILGLQLSYFLLVLAVPLAILAAIFWFARRQDALDHRYDVTGSQP
jgi:putative solute:sodium symporter small subunit